LLKIGLAYEEYFPMTGDPDAVAGRKIRISSDSRSGPVEQRVSILRRKGGVGKALQATNVWEIATGLAELLSFLPQNNKA
jgi:hypothetical protein